MAFAFPEANNNWKELTKKNHVTEARKSPIDPADILQRFTQRLREKLNKIQRTEEENETLIHRAMKMCKDEAVSQWLKQEFEFGAFDKLGDMFHFLKKHIDEEEKKDHSDRVHITLLAHGAIRDSMIPASCLLPLSTIKDVVLYSPWNCTILADAAYAVATGIMKPQHRVFNCYTKNGCQVPGEEHRPTKLPNHWNSMRRAGHQKIPNITLSPLKPPTDAYLKRFESLTKQYGLPERNHVIIPYILPAEEESSQSVPFYVVSLALSLALLETRFKATVHLTTCLGDQSAGQKFDTEYLKNQYACTVNNTVMTTDPHIFRKWF
uniref:uncharacterized protein n=1 Tax=Semicossyphus pulcher TaxID=241346 RepID=UPI0037E8617F